jgi:hypothetical protein
MARRVPAGLDQERIGIMGKRGPASGYRPEHCDTARRFLGATTEELARLFGVHRNTITAWMTAHPEFKVAIQEGRDVADANIAERLYQRGLGYERPAVKFVRTAEGVERFNFTEHVPPDTRACIFWLRNRRRRQWSERADRDNTAAEELLAVLEAAGERARNVRRTRG